MAQEFKIAVFGDGGIGKSATIIQFVQHHFVDEYDPTFDDNFRKQVMIDDEVTLLEIYDTVSYEEYSWNTDQIMRSSQGFVLMYSITRRRSFEEVSAFYEKILRVKDTEGWEIPMILVGNKCDLEDDREVTKQEGMDLALSWDIPFMEASAKNRINIEEQFFDLIRHIRSGTLPKEIDRLKQRRRRMKWWQWLDKQNLDKKIIKLSDAKRKRELKSNIYQVEKKIEALPSLPQPPTVVVRENDVINDITTLYNNNKSHSDVTVYVNNTPFYCHMALLSVRCPVLYNKLKSEKTKSGTMEVTLKDITLNSFTTLLQFIYSGKVKEIPKDEDLKANLLESISTYNLPHLHQGVLGKEELSENYIKDLRTLLAGDSDSDATFVVEQKKFRAHKFILGTRCAYFDGLFSHGWKENQTGESTYKVTSISAKAFRPLLEFLYTGEVTSVSRETAVELLIVANQYTLPRLKELCEQFLISYLDKESVMDCYFGAQLNLCCQLEQYCIYLMQQPQVYESIATSDFKKVDSEAKEKVKQMYDHITQVTTEKQSLMKQKAEYEKKINLLTK